MATVGQITDKISALKSRIAIVEGLNLHLRANFVSTDAGPPEMAFTRDDYATVPEEHIGQFADDNDASLKELHAELEQWESMPVKVPGTGTTRTTRAKKPRNKVATRKRSNGTTS